MAESLGGRGLERGGKCGGRCRWGLFGRDVRAFWQACLAAGGIDKGEHRPPSLFCSFNGFFTWDIFVLLWMGDGILDLKDRFWRFLYVFYSWRTVIIPSFDRGGGLTR